MQVDPVDDTDAHDAGETLGALDANPPDHRDATTPSQSDADPDDGPTRVECPDRLSGTGAVAGPQGLMIQIPTIQDECELVRALQHVCDAHPEMKDLIITSTEVHQGSSIVAEFDADKMEVLTPFFDCFENVFVGTMTETFLADPYAPSTILDGEARWTWLRAAQEIASQTATWMDARVGDNWHWYISYEANLNAFTDAEYRSAYIALLQQHISDLMTLHEGVISWSPTFWVDPSTLDSIARSALQSALSDVFDRVPLDWVLIQDHLGVQPDWTCDDAVTYYDLVRAAGPGLASVQINTEYFTLAGGGIGPGEPAELASRIACYQRANASIGASFEVRYWYDTHGH